MYQRVIFLDIDGVLRRVGDIEGIMNSTLVTIFCQVIENTSARIVISSNWRHGKNWKAHIRKEFREAGWDNPPIIGRTQENSGIRGGRGNEIADWLHTYSTADFVIIDDIIYDLLPEQAEHIIECDENIGFTQQNAQEILRRWT